MHPDKGVVGTPMAKERKRVVARLEQRDTGGRVMSICKSIDECIATGDADG